MKITLEKLNFGVNLGFKIGRLEFLWGSKFEFAIKEFDRAKKEILDILSNNNFKILDVDFRAFSNSIIYYYNAKDIEIFYSILIGICLQRSLLIGTSNNEDNNKEIEKLSLSSLYSIPAKIIGDVEQFFVFIKSLNNESFNIFIATSKIYDYLENLGVNKKIEKTQSEVKKYVFISYSSKNQNYAESVRKLFIEEGIENWMAPYDIPAGSKYAHVINDAIENSSCVVLLLSAESQISEFVEREIERAIAYKKTIISMHIDDSILNSGFKYYLGSEQIVPIKSFDKESFEIQKIIRSIKAILNA